MGKSIGLRTKILVLLSLPLISLAYLTARTATDRAAEARETGELVTLVQLSVRIGDLLHETQKERGSSSLFLSSKGTKFGDKLAAQRSLTDEQIKKLDTFTAGAAALPAEIRLHVQKVQNLVGQLGDKRAAVSSMTVAPKEIMEWYTGLNEELLSSIESISSKSSNAELGRFSMGYLAFLRAKEKTGLERAQLSNVFGTDAFAPGQFFKVASLIAAQDSYLQVFSSSADPELISMHRTRMAAPLVAEVTRMEQIARDKAATGGFGVDATVWFTAMTSKIELLKQTENALAAGLVARADAVMSAAQASLRNTVAGLVGMLAVVMVLALVLAHNIVGPVRQLTSIADRVSNGDIKQEVNVQASGEIGELADSFKRMVNAFKIMDSMANAEAPGGE